MVLAISVVAWILAILAESMREFLGTFYGMIVVAVFFFVPFMVILGAYGKIAQVARAHAHGRGNLTFRKVNITFYCYNRGQKSLDTSTKTLANHSARIHHTHALFSPFSLVGVGGGEVEGPEGALKTVEITLPKLFLIYI